MEQWSSRSVIGFYFALPVHTYSIYVVYIRTSFDR